MKVVIAGGRGFIGKHLADHFLSRGDELIILSRQANGHFHFWDPEKKQIDPSLLESSDLVINLCGESIVGRWNQEKMDRIRDSRLISTQFLCKSLLKLKNPPKLYIGASAIGYYPESFTPLSEESLPGRGYLSEICRQWEEIPPKLLNDKMRLAIVRFGIVLGKEGGMLKKMLTPFKWGLGGVMGSGDQLMSWITIDDLVGAIDHLISHEELSGSFNFTTPHPISNREFTKLVGKQLHRPTFCAMPKSLLHLLFGSGGDLFLKSNSVYPARLLKSGYQFQYPEVQGALKKIFALKTLSWHR